MFSRRRLAMIMAELIGTAILTFAILAIANSAVGISFFVAIGAGVTLAMLVLMIGASSGAHVNPAVTLGLWTLRKITTLRAIAYIAAQFLGALAAWQLFVYLTGRPLQDIAATEFNSQVFSAEIAGAFVFTFGVAAALYQQFTGGKLAATIGGSLMLGVIVAGIVSNGLINPAAALGAQSFDVAHVAGPIVGAIIGMNLYVLLFAPEYSLLSKSTLRSLSSRVSIGVTTSTDTKKTTANKPARKAPATKKNSTRKTAKKK